MKYQAIKQNTFIDEESDRKINGFINAKILYFEFTKLWNSIFTIAKRG